jgi:hypothetical protein
VPSRATALLRQIAEAFEEEDMNERSTLVEVFGHEHDLSLCGG